MTNNIKRGYNYDCVSAPNVGHILFEYPIVDTIRKEHWQVVSKLWYDKRIKGQLKLK